jgi:hypothetical protein
MKHNKVSISLGWALLLLQGTTAELTVLLLSAETPYDDCEIPIGESYAGTINVTDAADDFRASWMPLHPGNCSNVYSCDYGTYRPVDHPYKVFSDESLLQLDVKWRSGCPGFAWCEPGFHCKAVLKTACGAGFYSEHYGSTRCLPCPAGYTCKQASYFVPALGHPAYTRGALSPAACQQSASFCPERSAEAVAVSRGYYTVLDTSFMVYKEQRICPVGHFCLNGLQFACPAGTYGITQGLFTPGCSGVCPATMWCPLGTAEVDFENPRANRRCMLDAERYHLSDPTEYATRAQQLQDAVELQSNRAVVVVCPRACYCDSDGKAHACPPGRAGEKEGETDPNCSTECAPGWYCPYGSLSPFEYRCGSPELYCPGGSALPRVAPPGYITIGGDETTRSDLMQCPMGRYCQGGTSIPCRSGLFGDEHGLSEPRCSGYCAAGYYCPQESTMSTPRKCGTAALYCPLGSSLPHLVPPGYYSVRTVITLLRYLPPDASSATLGVCAPSGMPLSDALGIPTLANRAPQRWHTILPLGAEGRHITAASLCEYVLAAMNGTNELTTSAFVVSMMSDPEIMDGVMQCEPGYACNAGVRLPCPAGTYAPDSEAIQCLPCEPGYYCLAGAISPTQCGNVTVYCPFAGMDTPLFITRGHYSISSSFRLGPDTEPSVNASILLNQYPSDGDYIRYNLVALENRIVVDEIGASKFVTTRTGIVPCPPGSYCLQGYAHECPAGRFGDGGASWNSSCSGPCKAGYFCSTGSISATQHVCGYSFNFCPSGSSKPLLASTGYYTAGGNPGDVPAAFADWELICNHTLSREDLALAILRSEAAYSTCSDSSYSVIHTDWPPLATQRTGLAGEIILRANCSFERNKLLGPMLPISMDPARACMGSILGGLSTRTYQEQCEIGFYCDQGLKYLCPAGRFGSVQGEYRESCEGPCAAGFYCGWGSITATATACGGVDRYCPPASGSPTPVDVGFYTDPAEDALHRSKQIRCEQGYYCEHGVRYQCPPGTFSDALAMSSLFTCRDCPPGFFCPKEAQVDPVEFPCGITEGAAVYCPGGSAAPIAVSEGYYTVGEITHSEFVADNITRWNQLPCPTGMYCQLGILQQCPAGTYGNTSMLATPFCSGPCEPGYFCPPGSISPVQYRCGDIYSVISDLRDIIIAGVNQSNASINVDPIDPAGPMLDGAVSVHSQLGIDAFTSIVSSFHASGVDGLGFRSQFTELYQSLPAGGYEFSAGSSACPPASIFDYTYALSEVYITAANEIVLYITNVSVANVSTACYSLGYNRTHLYTNASISAVNTSGVLISMSIPYESGMRLRLPSIGIALDSVATLHRTVLVGGPSSVYCPAGSGLPTMVPDGHYTIRAAANSSSDPAAPLASSFNLTQDAITLTEPGYFSVAGIRYPCNAGLYGAEYGGSVHTCTDTCPAGYYCPLATATPIECPDSSYSVGTAEDCIACPWNSLPPPVLYSEDSSWPVPTAQPVYNEVQRCKDSRSCCVVKTVQTLQN